MLALATAKPHTIILVGRSPISLATVATKVSAIDASIRVHISLIDFTSLQTVRYGATMLLNDTRIRRIDAIINNAAVCSSEHGRTVDGLETHFQVNAVAPFLLTNLLMPKLVKSAEARVVNVTDSAYADAHRDFADYDSLPINFDPLVDGYAQSKLSNVYFTLSLGRRFRSDGLRAFSVDPGSAHAPFRRRETAHGPCSRVRHPSRCRQVRLLGRRDKDGRAGMRFYPLRCIGHFPSPRRLRGRLRRCPARKGCKRLEEGGGAMGDLREDRGAAVRPTEGLVHIRSITPQCVDAPRSSSHPGLLVGMRPGPPEKEASWTSVRLGILRSASSAPSAQRLTVTSFRPCRSRIPG